MPRGPAEPPLTDTQRAYLAEFDRFLLDPDREARARARVRMRARLGDMLLESGTRLKTDDEMAWRPGRGGGEGVALTL